MGEYHVCRSTLLEIVKLKKDTLKCIQFNHKMTNVSKQAVKDETLKENKIFLGKIFVNIGPGDLLLPLSLKLL